MRIVLGLLTASLALVLPAAASAETGRVTVGVDPGTSAETVGAAVEEATGGTVVRDLGPLDAVVVEVPDEDAALELAGDLPGAAYAEPARGIRRIAFAPNDPLARDQWYLPRIRAFDYWASLAQPPTLPPVLVAVIDSGIDAGHPEFAGRIYAKRSFVSPRTTDRLGHGTMVAGEIAAALDNGQGIAGAGFPVQLIVAKVIGRDGLLTVENEARAIRWAVDRGAQVINLSFGGPRDPTDPHMDDYSALEHSAIDYATRRGRVVVAATGNCLTRCPERYANWPAALPHVIGVSATTPLDRTPGFSNRDRVHNDLAAPGTEIVSTLPRGLTDPACGARGYTICAWDPGYRNPRGTSFSAPLVAAAAALVLAQASPIRPHASQVTALVERSARDIGAEGRDRRSGGGLLDAARAVRRLAALPPRDRLEPNDDAGARARRVRGASRTLEATLDRWEDRRDVYRVWLRAGRRAVFRLSGAPGSNPDLVLWKPGTSALPEVPRRKRAARSAGPGSRERIAYRAPRSGWYYLETRLGGGKGSAYRLTISKL